MSLLLYVRWGDQTHPVELPADARVGDLRRAAQEATGQLRSRLLFGGAALEDDSMPLADSGLSSECVVEAGAADTVHVVWLNADRCNSELRLPEGSENGSDDGSDDDSEASSDDGGLASMFYDHSTSDAPWRADWDASRTVLKKLRRRYRSRVLRIARRCGTRTHAVPPTQSEKGRRLFADFAADWSRQTGLCSAGPIDEHTTALQLLESIYSPGSREREAMTEQLRADAPAPDSDDEPEDTVVPHGHVFITGASFMPQTPLGNEVVWQSMEVSSGAWMFEVCVKRAVCWSLQFGWKPGHWRSGQWVGWGLCMRGDLPSAAATEPGELAGIDAGELGHWTWEEGDTVATCFDGDRRRILYGMPGKGWFVGHTDVCGEVAPTIRAVEAMCEINFGDRPFRCEPPVDGCRGVLGVVQGRVLRRAEFGTAVTTAGSLMPSRGLLSHQAETDLKARNRRLREEQRVFPSSPFEDGWVPFSHRRWFGGGWESRSVCVPPRGLAVLLAASTTADRPSGSEPLRYVCAHSARESMQPWLCKGPSFEDERRERRRAPTFPFTLWSVRTMRTSSATVLRLDAPLYDCNVRPGDVLVLSTRVKEVAA
eukprot:TRINITY_DN641_c0_g1_i4.p1 TRINITY_DN641_c0_g1~~TRINITY_DN641_c0_g1_i4.p1  ORF type:complete len:597 (+),score=132.17 TRINITY_DN641_c0_g1_i4:74-1864(+)